MMRHVLFECPRYAEVRPPEWVGAGPEILAQKQHRSGLIRFARACREQEYVAHRALGRGMRQVVALEEGKRKAVSPCACEKSYDLSGVKARQVLERLPLVRRVRCLQPECNLLK